MTFLKMFKFRDGSKLSSKYLHSKRSRFNIPVSETSSLAASISIDADDDETAIHEFALEREKLKD